MRYALCLAALLSAGVAAQPSGLAARLDAVVDAAHAAGAFDGVVLVGRGDQVLYRRAVGLADRSWDVPNSAGTRFPWASVTKQVTAALVLQLVDEGAVGLQTPLGDVLPGLRPGHAGRVTLRHLLTNTSGLPDADDLARDYESLPDGAATAVVGRALAADLAFEPGSQFRYTNTDFLVLGRVIEAVTGQTYADALQSRILGPLGMAETALVRDDRVEPRLPTGYLVDSTGVRPMPPARLATYGAAGALAGTAGDLFRFDRALLADRLFPRALRDSMTTADPSLGFVALSVWRYGLDVDGQPVTLVERQGWIWGYRALNLLAPDEDLVLIVLANTDAADLSRTYTRQGFSFDLVRAALGGPGGG